MKRSRGTSVHPRLCSATANVGCVCDNLHFLCVRKPTLKENKGTDFELIVTFIGLARIVYLVISLPKIPYIHRI